MVEKPCRRCGVVKRLSLFATRSDARDRRSPWCKACFTAHYYANSATRAADRRRWTAENPDYFKEYYRANRERRIAEATAYVREHPEERKAYEQLYRAANREKIAEKSRAYQRLTGHKYSRARSLAQRTRVIDVVDRREVYARAKGACGVCGDPVDPVTFHVDHILPLARGGEHSYANTQPTHPICNLRKGARDAPTPRFAHGHHGPVMED